MGDGRYYSVEQFQNIVILTLIIIYVTSIFMMLLYKTSTDKKSRRLLRPSLLLLTGLILRFCEEVIVNVEMIYQFRLLWMFTFISCHILFILDIIYINKKSRYALDAILIFIPLMITIYFIPEIFIINKTPLLQYGRVFDVFLGLSIIINMINSVKLYQKTNIKAFIYYYWLLWIIPTIVIWGFVLVKGHDHIMILCLVYPLYAVGLYKIALLRTPYRTGITVFRNIRNMLDDYIYITDENGDLIYTNKKARQAAFLKNVKTIDLESLNNMFDKEIHIREAYNKSFIKYYGDNEMYFSFSKSVLSEKDQNVGYIITLMDITELIQMLDMLGEKQEETTLLNRQLLEYKEIVYEFEKENETIKILNEISEKQETAMVKLNELVDGLGMSRQFETDISNIISKAKEDLSDVRMAVSTYLND